MWRTGGRTVKAIINHTIGMLIASSVFAVATGAAVAQDPTQVDAKHYKVTLENDQVRILRITYDPHEKSIMHEHPNSIAVFTLPDGKSEERDAKAGQSVWNPAGKHLPENLGDRPFEVVLIEMKAK
jgi:quercetin dioxygenase-like cupin family protein